MTSLVTTVLTGDLLVPFNVIKHRYTALGKRRRATALIVSGLAIVCLIAGVGRVLLHHGDDPDAGEAVSHPRPTWWFYRPPAPLPPAPPGSLIRAQPVPDLQAGIRGWRILYHSRSTAGADIAVSGVVLEPANPPSAGERPVVAWAHGTTGSAEMCAPSTDANPIQGIEDGRALLQAGYAIVATDYEGLGTPGPHPYLIADSEARSVLDAVRAAHHLPDAGIGTSFAAFGHSQGGQAALAVGESVGSYAPDLTVLAVAAASPPTDMPALTQSITRQDFGTAYLLAAAAGYSAAHPSADLSTILTPRGAAALHLIEDACNEQLVTALTGASPTDIFTRDPRTTPPWSTGFHANSLPITPTAVPIFVLQGDNDPVIPADITTQAVRRMCSLHDTVNYHHYRDTQHNVVPAASGDLNAWLHDQFNHVWALSDC